MQNEENLNENSENINNEDEIKNKFYQKINFYENNLDVKDFEMLITDIDKYSEVSYRAINNKIMIYNKIINTVLDVFGVQINRLRMKNNITIFERACLSNIYYYMSRNCDLSYKDISYLLGIKFTQQYISYIINIYVINIEKLNINEHIKQIIKENNKKIKEQLRTLI